MDIRQIQHFSTIVREGSFSRAARKLHIGQPALSKQIQALSVSWASSYSCGFPMASVRRSRAPAWMRWPRPSSPTWTTSGRRFGRRPRRWWEPCGSACRRRSSPGWRATCRGGSPRSIRRPASRSSRACRCSSRNGSKGRGALGPRHLHSSAGSREPASVLHRSRSRRDAARCEAGHALRHRRPRHPECAAVPSAGPDPGLPRSPARAWSWGRPRNQHRFSNRLHPHGQGSRGAG